jgi:hypothetical protein
MAMEVTQNTNDARLAHDQKAAQAPALPSEKLTNLLLIFQDYLNVADKCDIPDLWHQWVVCKKWQEFGVLSKLLQAHARGPLAFSNAAPVVTPKLVQDLTTFTFLGDLLDDIKTGLHPFIIADGTLEHHQANLELSRLYGFLHSGEQMMMLANPLKP